MMHRFRIFLFVIMITCTAQEELYAQNFANYDTIRSEAIVYNGDTMEAKTLATLLLYAWLPEMSAAEKAAYLRLRNAVLVTYPYAYRAAQVLNDMNQFLETVSRKDERKKYIRSREKELKRDFAEPISNLSVYQGRVLMKLINRQTGNNCFEIIKEYRGGLNARVYQTVAFFFNSSLKQPYDAMGEDRLIEKFVREAQYRYGYYDNPWVHHQPSR